MKRTTVKYVSFFALIALGMAASVANADVKTGLVAYYACEEGAGNVAHNGAKDTIAQDGQIQGTEGVTYEWVEGRLGNFGILFHGQDGTVVDCGTWNPSAETGQLTAAAWIKWAGLNAKYQGVVSKRDGWTATDTCWHIELNTDTGNIAFGRWESYPGFGTNIPPEGEWQHVAVTFDGTTTTMYIDGVSVGTSTVFSFGPKTDAHVVFGAVEGAGWNPFNGVIDEVRIYSRGLTADDILELLEYVGGADAGDDFAVYGGDKATLSGAGPSDWQTAVWAQVGGQPAVTLQPTGPMEAQFDAPQLQIGTLLTFLLTVNSQSTGQTFDEVNVIVRAINVPKVAPSNLRVYPIDQGALLGFRLLWDPLIDAEKYQGALKLGGVYFWLYNTTNAYLDFTGGAEGVEQTVAVRGENKFSVLGSPDPSKHGLQSEDVTYKVMRNLAAPAPGGAYPPLAPVQGKTYAISHYAIARLNDGILDVNNDSWDGLAKLEDFWGYLWDQPRYFDRLVYYGGTVFGNGGWFTSLKVQYTKDGGTTWIDIPGVATVPPYDFSDSGVGRKNFTRYDILIPTVKGNGIRIYGRPGGTSQFTSIAELEVYGDETRPGGLLVQGVDATYPEGGTATLDGSATFSTRGPITSWKWEKVSGPDVVINNSTSAKATFTAPIVTSDTVMVFKLTAGDGTETLSDSDVRITIKNLVTTAVAGPDQRALEGTQVTLDASGSTSTSGALSYLWTQTAGTLAGVTGSTGKTPSFTAPVIWGFTEDLKFRLDVNDGSGGTSSEEVVVTVYNFAGLVAPLGPGYIKDLLHMGETNVDRVTAPLAIATDCLKTFGGEAKVNPRPDEEYNFTGTDVTVTTNPAVWTPLHDTTGWFGDEGLDNFMQYYHVYIISPEARDVLWHFRHDDEIRVWNNGVLAVARDSWDGDPGDVAIERYFYGQPALGKGLNKGINSLTFKFHDGTEGNYLAVGLTDFAGNEFTDLQYSFGLPMGIADAYAARNLPDWYEPDGTVDVSLSFRVDPANTPGSVSIREEIPPGIPVANITAPGATVTPSGIVWTLTGNQVKTGTFTYSFTVPREMTQSLHLAGTVSFGTTSVDIIGEDVVYAVPSEPLYLMVEMLMGAHLSWAPPATEGTASYNVFRSVNGGTWAQIGSTTATSFVDSAVTAGNNYSYAVSAIGVQGSEGPQSSPTPQAQLPSSGTFQTREAEDFNYDGGKFPWTSAVTVPALEAPSATEIGTPQQYDYYHPRTDGPAGRSYRPLDNRNDQPDPAYADSGTGVAIDVRPEDNDPTAIVTKIGWINAGSWYRYGFNVTQAGWIKLVFRVACPDGGTIAAYWDETLVGTASYVSGSYDTYTWAAIEQFEELTTGVHHLRVALLSGELDFDKIAIGFNWVAPKRETIWSDNFDTYSTDADVKAGGWTIENGSGYPDAAWRLWDTEGPMLNNQDPNLAGMYDKYMISDSDLAPDATLDERFVSKEVDCINHMKVRLNFSKNYNRYEDPDHLQVAEVDIRVFDNGVWGNWVNLGHWDRDTGSSSTPEQMDIASLADKKKIQVRWHFFGAKWDYWFAIDQVRVSGEPPPAEKPKIGTIGKTGNTMTLGWKAFGAGQYTVQQSDDLVAGTWTNAPGTWPSAAPSWSTEIPAVKKRYYRVVGQ